MSHLSTFDQYKCLTPDEIQHLEAEAYCFNIEQFQDTVKEQELIRLKGVEPCQECKDIAVKLALTGN